MYMAVIGELVVDLEGYGMEINCKFVKIVEK